MHILLTNTSYYTHTIHALYYTIGTNPEESAEDVGTVQVPSSWRPIVQDTATLQLFFDYYLTSSPPSSSLALQSLVHLSSIRRSLFPSEKERAVFLQALMTGMSCIVYSIISSIIYAIMLLYKMFYIKYAAYTILFHTIHVTVYLIYYTLYYTYTNLHILLYYAILGIHTIMSTKKGLEHMDNYHEFCRLLGMVYIFLCILFIMYV